MWIHFDPIENIKNQLPKVKSFWSRFLLPLSVFLFCYICHMVQICFCFFWQPFFIWLIRRCFWVLEKSPGIDVEGAGSCKTWGRSFLISTSRAGHPGGKVLRVETATVDETNPTTMPATSTCITTCATDKIRCPQYQHVGCILRTAPNQDEQKRGSWSLAS